MADPDEIAQQQHLLEIYRDNLAHYLEQQATLEIHTPPYVSTGIRKERENIKRVKEILRTWNVFVHDHPNDEPPPKQQTTQDWGSQADARESQGFINSASGPISQNYGAGTVINIHGGDFRASNIPIGNTVSGDLHQKSQDPRRRGTLRDVSLFV